MATKTKTKNPRAPSSPGPWVVNHIHTASDLVRYRIESEPTSLDVANLEWFDPEPHDRRQLEADAHLIAAAPDLRDAVEAALDEFATGSFNPHRRARVVAFLRAAIARAEGK